MEKNSILTSGLTRPSEAVERALEWFSRTEIQNRGSNPQFRGGVNAWFDLKSSNYPFIYSEITGYAVNLFLFGYSLTGNEAFLKQAELAGDWLVLARDRNCGLVINRAYYKSDHEPYYEACIFTFDQWMIIFGLCNLFEVTGNQRYGKAAQEMGSFLIQHTFLKDGSMYPMVDLKTGQPSAAHDKWSRQPGSFHAKALLALHRLYVIGGNEDYFACAKRLAQYALSQQKKEGRFVTQTNEQSTHLHPHLYSMEGLMYFGLAQNDSQILQTCERALSWVLDSESEDGTTYSFFKEGKFVPYERADILAQTLRLGSLLRGRLEHQKNLQSKLERLKSKLLSYQVKEGAQRGGFLYGKEQDGTVHDHVNAWVTMFALQALHWYDSPSESDSRDYFHFFI